MDRDAIEVFVKVVQVGSFAGAARQLSLPTTTVSAKIARLEKKLGTTLIQRTTRRLHITPSGELYFNRCLKALNELNAAEAELESASKAPTGTLKITCTYDVAHYLLPSIIEKYLATYPNVSVELIVTNRIVDLVAEGIDLAIRAGELVDSQMIARKLINLTNGIWASPEYIKKNPKIKEPKDLEKHSYIHFKRRGSKTFELFDGKKKVTVSAKGRIDSDELDSLKFLAERGLGYVTLPEFIARDSVNAGTLVRLLPSWKLADLGKFSIVYPAQNYVTPKLREFVRLATTQVDQ